MFIGPKGFATSAGSPTRKGKPGEESNLKTARVFRAGARIEQP